MFIEDYMGPEWPGRKKADSSSHLPEPTADDYRWVRSLEFVREKNARLKIAEAVRDGHVWRVDWALSQKKLFSDKPAYPVNDLYPYRDNEGDERRDTLLNIAISANRVEMVRYLISCKPDNLDSYARRAVKMGSVEMTVLFLDAGVKLNGFSSDKSRSGTLLYEAAKAGHPSVVHFLLTRGAKMDESSQYVRSPVHSAASLGSVATLELFRDVGGMKDFNISDPDDGYTPLHVAAALSKGDKAARTIPWLMENGANPLARTRKGMTPLQLAIKQDNADTVAELLKYPSWERKDVPDLLKNSPEDICEKLLIPALKLDDEWKLAAPARVSRETERREQGVMLTEEFNFQSRERLTFAHTFEGHIPCGFSRQDFSQISDRDAVEEAWRKLKELGGEAPHPFIPRDTRNKQPLL